MARFASQEGLGWLAIMRLGLVQAALGSVVVLTTSTLNRVMVVELALAAAIPGALVGLHYAVQLLRPVFGHRSDMGGGRTAWILGGMAVLAIAGTAASATTLLFERSFLLGLSAAIVAYAFIGFGIGACGTSLLALLASRTRPKRRPAAATIVWMMMVAGIVITAIITGSLLDPYSHSRLVAVTAGVGAVAFLLTLVAIAGVERRAADLGGERPATLDFRRNLTEIWADPVDRLFTIFVFVSMLAYSTQDLILEPFGGLLFGMTPGETTKLSGVQHAGVLIGMALVGVAGSLFSGSGRPVLKILTVGGCVFSAVALGALAFAAMAAPAWPLKANIALLGFANGAFAVAAIGTMMELAGAGNQKREGIRMGVWGAAQAISFGLGGFAGTLAIDVARAITQSVPVSFAAVFTLEAGLFVLSALMALRIGTQRTTKIENRLGGFSAEPAE
ncbi:MAG TPA: BCD family MFS transporter [Rhizobiaceae bacterium]|nr:BCD family MFS transporter [Rhizobiaceae bacterium]